MKAAESRQLTCDYFDRTAAYWDGIYQNSDLPSLIYQDRKRIILQFVTEAGLPAGARVLEIGCGAGHLAVELALRGLNVTAIDTAPAMIQLTADRARRAGVEITAMDGSVERLGFREAEFALVVAVGVLPWLPALEGPILEMARVTRPGGFVIATADRAGALHRWIDPRLHPLTVAAKRHLRGALESAGAVQALPRGRLHSGSQIDNAIRKAGLAKLADATAGFGPFTFFNAALLPDRAGVRLHRWLQEKADRQQQPATSTGAHYIVLGKKTEASI